MIHRAYRSGLKIALRRWPVVIILFLASLAAALSFGAAAWSWLSLALDKSLATRSLLNDLSVQVFIDLFIHHGESFLMLLAGGIVMTVGFISLGAWLNAITVAAVCEEEPLSASVARGSRTYPTYLGLAVVVNLLHAAAITASALLDRTLMHWAAESTSEITGYAVAALSAIFGGLAVLFFATAHDHARIRVTNTDAGVIRALGWAFAFVLRRQRRTFPLAVLLLATSIASWVIYQTVAWFIPARSALGVASSLLWGEVLLLVRMFIRVWWFAAETHLQRATERSAF